MIQKKLCIFFCGLIMVILVACAKPENKSNLVSEKTSVNTIEEDAISDVEKKMESEKASPNKNKEIANSNTQKLNKRDKGESLKGKRDKKNQKKAKTPKIPDIVTNNQPTIQINIEAPEHKTVEAYDPTLYPGWVTDSKDNPLSIETTLSINSEKAKADEVQEYEEKTFPVLDYTYDSFYGCWKFTKSSQRNFYFYKLNDTWFRPNIMHPQRMIRYYLSGDTFVEEYFNTENRFYAPYEDDKGNIYAECGRYDTGGYIDNPRLSIIKMNSAGKTLREIDIADIIDKDKKYKGFAMIKKNIIAILSEQTQDSRVVSQIKIINIDNKKVLAVINLKDQVTMNIKSDGDYFALISSSYQSVYVFNANTFQLLNTVDTTKCKELCVYEWEVNGGDNGKYNNLKFELDIKDGKIYFLRHSGIYRMDCLGTEITKVLDGVKFAGFRDQSNKYTSFLVGKKDDFYILGVYVDEESATTMWHYTKKQ